MKETLQEWVENFLKFNPTDLFGNTFTDMLKLADNEMNVGKPLFDILAICGTALTIVFFLLEINHAWGFNGRDMTLKDVGAPLLKFAAATILITNGWKVITGFVDMSNDLIDKVNTGGSFSASSVEQTLKEGIPESNTGESKSYFERVQDWIDDQELGTLLWILMLIISLLIFAAKLFAGAMLFYKAVLFKMEFLLRLGFTPVAFADIYSGLSSTAVKWLKGAVAMAMYGVSFFVVQGVGAMVAMSTPEINSLMDLITASVKNLIVPFAMVGLLSTARQVSQEVVG